MGHYICALLILVPLKDVRPILMLPVSQVTVVGALQTFITMEKTSPISVKQEFHVTMRAPFLCSVYLMPVTIQPAKLSQVQRVLQITVGTAHTSMSMPMERTLPTDATDVSSFRS